MSLSLIQAQPANPLHYLACCGIFEIASLFDSSATARWHCQTPVAMHLQCLFDDATLASIIIDTFTKPERWRPITLPEQEEVWRFECELCHADQSRTVSLDWWQETLNTDGSIDAKSAWKMYAGQQTIEKITADMVNACVRLAPSLPIPLTLTSLLDAQEGMTGRFGLDPRSSRSALDVGYSPNDLGLPVATYPFTELLATIGLQSFFPARCGLPGRLVSTRGWQREPEDAFFYRLWMEPLPILLARAAAMVEAIGPAIPLAAPRATRKNYSNLTLAHTH